MLIFLLALAAILTFVAQRREGWQSPIVLAMLLWTATFAIALVAHLGVTPVNSQAARVLAVGMIALTLPVLTHRRGRPGAAPAVVTDKPPAIRLVVVSVVLLVMVAIGVLKFRSAVAASYGSGFGSLSDEQIRAAQTSTARGGGLSALFIASTPMLACVGVYGFVRYSRLWLGVIVIAVAASAYTPARLPTVALGITAAAFYIYCRNTYGVRERKRRSGIRQTLFGVVIAVLLILFFVQGGDSTGKNRLTASQFPFWSGPTWAIQPILYITGGLSALSGSLAFGANPYDRGSSIFALERIYHGLQPHSHVPLSAVRPTRIPTAAFNVYTAFGQQYFDFGFGGVVILSYALGWLAMRSHRRARSGHVVSMYVSATLLSLLLTTQQAYRLFFLDVDFQLLIGAAVFAAVERPVRERQHRGRGRADPAGAGGEVSTPAVAHSRRVPME